MSSPQPPSDNDRPASGQENAHETAVNESATRPTPKRSSAPRSSGASRSPAAIQPSNAKTPGTRAPAPRKRSAAKPPVASPDGEAPEILDAMLGKRTSAAAITSSPAEPLDASTLTAAENSQPAETVVEAETASTPEAVVLPSAAAFFRAVPASQSVAQTAIPKPVEGTSSEQVPTASAAQAPVEITRPMAAVGTPAPVASTEAAARPARSVNDLADRLDDSRFFSSLFDVTFTSYVTRKLAGPVYVVGLVLIALGLVVGFTNSFGIAIAANSPGGAFVFLLGVLVTMVAAILAVLLLRVTIEVFCAIIEIAQNTRRRRPPRK